MKSFKSIFLFAILFFLADISSAASIVGGVSPDAQWLKKQLKQGKFSQGFSKAILDSYEEASFEKVLHLNILGFLQPVNHNDMVTDQAVEATNKLVEEQRKAFKDTEKKFSVSPEVIAALLWIETRHGVISGNFHVTSVYLHLLQGQRKEVAKALAIYARNEYPRAKQYTQKKLEKTISERLERKSKWAQEQLVALQKMYTKQPQYVQDLRGSFAGAFGWPQFIPSSFLSYSKAASPRKSADLFDPADAIRSVGFYLKSHGWNPKKHQKQMKSLMAYNNSEDYAEAILEIARRAKALKASHRKSVSKN